MAQANTSSTAKKAPLNHELYMSILMTPDMANFIGNVHGGDLLKMRDQVAYACASRYSVVRLTSWKTTWSPYALRTSSQITG